MGGETTQANADGDAECDDEGRLAVESQSINEVDDNQKSLASQVIWPGEPFEPSHAQSRFDATEKLCVTSRTARGGSLKPVKMTIGSRYFDMFFSEMLTFQHVKIEIL